MNKTYIANEKHPWLKAGVEVELDNFHWYIKKEKLQPKIPVCESPVFEPDWYDDVKWKPNKGETYLFIVNDEVMVSIWCDVQTDCERYEKGNCYQTKEEAEQALERVLKAYKGE